MFFHPGDAAASDGPPVRFETVSPSLGLWSDKALQRDFQVFGDKESFEEYYGDSAPLVQKAGAADFRKSYLVAIHQGLCPTGGYSIQVRSVRARADTVTVTVSFQEPGPDDIVTMSMTTPHLLLLVPRRRKVQHPVFRFRSESGALLAERRPMCGKAEPD